MAAWDVLAVVFHELLAADAHYRRLQNARMCVYKREFLCDFTLDFGGHSGSRVYQARCHGEIGQIALDGSLSSRTLQSGVLRLGCRHHRRVKLLSGRR